MLLVGVGSHGFGGSPPPLHPRPNMVPQRVPAHVLTADGELGSGLALGPLKVTKKKSQPVDNCSVPATIYAIFKDASKR